MGERLWKSQVCLSGINGSKRVARMWNIMKMVVHDLIESMKMLEKWGVWCILIDVKYQSYGCATKFRSTLYVHRKRPELWPNEWILHHDNAPVHKALYVKQFLAQNSIAEIEHPLYSPDLAPNDFWLFPSIRSALKVQRFQDT